MRTSRLVLLAPLFVAACGGAPMPSAAPEPTPPPGGAVAAQAGSAREEAAADEAEPAAKEATATPAMPAAPPPPSPGRAGGAARSAPSAERGAPAASRPAVAVEQAAVKAGEWDDNANYREFQRYLASQSHLGFHRADVGRRQFIAVLDADGKGVPRCPITIADARGREVLRTTTAAGRAVLFPRAEGLADGKLTARARCEGTTASAELSSAQADGVVTLKLDRARSLPQLPGIDIAFILDTTGSMSEEIGATKATVQKVAADLGQGKARVRVGMVTFKDRTDGEVTQVFPMTTDVSRFSRDVGAIEASGGGDIPESVNEGLHAAISRLSWSQDAVAKVAFLIGDAPPHLDYANDADYAADMRRAAASGIKVFTIAASGMDALGQVVWRQIAQYTGATNMFVLRGGAGPQSTGGGDPASSCGGTQTAYTSGSLDVLMLKKIQGELRALDRDPLRIAGLGGDENAKPCAARLAIAGD